MKSIKRGFGESAASEAIGAVMLISVVVLAVAVIGVALTSQGTPQKLPAVSAIISANDTVISIYHDGGDSLKSEDLSITVNNNVVGFSKAGNPAPWTWSVGETLQYDMGAGTPQTVRVVYKPGSYTISAANFGAIGPGPVPTSPVTPTVTTPSPAPTVSAITPSGGNTGMTVSITSITGTNFMSGATAKLTRAGYPDIPLTGISVSSPTQMSGGTANLAGAAAGQWNIVVTNPDLKSGTLTNGFTVSNSAPAIISITPSSGTRGTIVSITNLAGTGFFSGATVRLNRTGSTAIPATSVVVVSSTQITCNFVLPAGTTVGPWDVVVTNPDMQNSTLTNAFTVSAAAPAVTAIIPNSSLQTTPVPVSVAGTGFQSGANLTLKRTGYPDINATGVVFVSSNLITGNFNLATATPGQWDVAVINPDSQSGTLPGGFIVRTPTPTVTALTNTTGVRGWTVVERITGTNFLSGAVVRLVNTSAGPDIIATNVVVVSPTVITCNFDLTGATPSRRNVTVKNPNSDTGTFANSFTVTSNSPTVSTFTPNSGDRGWPRTITSITGTGFQPGAQVRLTRTGQPDILASGVTVTSPTSISGATFNLLGVYVGTGATGTSTWRVNVSNIFDGQSGSAATFTVNSYRPTISSITPNTAARGTTVSITNLAGNYFQPGATVQLRNATHVIATGSSVNVALPTLITCQFTIPSGSVRPGTNAYYINVTNTDARTRNSGNIFSIT